MSAGMELQPRSITVVATVIAGLILSAPDPASMVQYNFTGNSTPASKLFTQTPKV